MSGITLFLEEFSSLEDPRIPGLLTYPLNEILLSTLCAVLCGNQDWDEISYWAEYHLEWLRQFLPYSNGIPTSQTFNRVFNAINSKKFKALFEGWVRSLQSNLKHKHIAIDGKTIRGSKQQQDGSGAIHIVSAFASEAGIVLGQEKVADKSNEITAIPELLERLSLEGTIITIDAMGTQKDIATTIISKKADYLLSLKQNQPNLYHDVELFFKENSKEVVWDEIEETDAGHGRIEVRNCTATSDISWLRERYPEWSNLRSIAMIKSLRINKKTHAETREIRYYISSLPAKAEHIQYLVRAHWGVENRLHWCLDVTFREDSCRVRTDHGSENLAIIRKIAFNMLRLNQSQGKLSLKKKILKASWDSNYLISTLLVNNL